MTSEPDVFVDRVVVVGVNVDFDGDGDLDMAGERGRSTRATAAAEGR